MKKRIITTIASITLIGGVTAGALMSQPEEIIEPTKTVQENVKEVKATTAPEAPQEAQEVETVANTTPAPEVAQSEPEVVEEPVIEARMTDEEAFDYISQAVNGDEHLTNTFKIVYSSGGKETFHKDKEYFMQRLLDIKKRHYNAHTSFYLTHLNNPNF